MEIKVLLLGAMILVSGENIQKVGVNSIPL